MLLLLMHGLSESFPPGLVSQFEHSALLRKENRGIAAVKSLLPRDTSRPRQGDGSVKEQFRPCLFPPLPIHDDPGLCGKGNARTLFPSQRMTSGCGSPPATLLSLLQVFSCPQSYTEAAPSNTTPVRNTTRPQESPLLSKRYLRSDLMKKMQSNNRTCKTKETTNIISRLEEDDR